ncbi:MAG: hypothetical protein IJC78_01760 [Clostridia bacterium]|nr:hypothetical protein [Clostridia bacterium]
MKKSVYSLVLNDDVVALVDRAAAKRGISRSSFINEVLARELAHVTPEMRIREIFDSLERIAEGMPFRVKEQPSDAMMSLFGSLSYKYNPTVRYSVELLPKTAGTIGALKVSFRTQSASFMEALSEFFYFLSGLESAYAPKGVSYTPENGKIARTLVVPHGAQYSADETGFAISEYIKMFDRALNTYFSYLPDTETAARCTAGVYTEYLKHTKYLI